MCAYPVNLLIGYINITKVESFAKKPRDKGTFILGPLFSKWPRVFQSLLDSFSIAG